MYQSLKDFAILRSLNLSKSSKFCNFRKNSQNFVIAAVFPQIWGLDASRDVITMRIQSKKGCFSVLKNGTNSLSFSSCLIYKSYIRQTNRKRNESTLLVWAQTVYLLGPEPRDALDHATPLYTALGDTVKKVESITSLPNLVRSFQIQYQNKRHWCENQEKQCSINTNLHRSPWI